jgi:hypothetical protein
LAGLGLELDRRSQIAQRGGLAVEEACELFLGEGVHRHRLVSQGVHVGGAEEDFGHGARLSWAGSIMLNASLTRRIDAGGRLVIETPPSSGAFL